jgi:hypothetical protein
MIAYLGSQKVNGINHAVLAEQTILTGRDSKNVVILIFNEKPNAKEVTLVSVDRILEGGLPMGGTKIDINLVEDISKEVMSIWNEAFERWVGAKVTLIALLGTKVVKGTNFIFIATINGLMPESKDELMLVTINDLNKRISFTDLLADKTDHALGYAFSW